MVEELLMAAGTTADALRRLAAAHTVDPTYESSIEGSSEADGLPPERVLSRAVPQSLGEWWRAIRSARLFVDREYGQWGLVLWPPDEIEARNRDLRANGRDDLDDGDIVVGEFLGDADLLMVRSEPDHEADGSVWIVAPIDPRPEWVNVAADLGGFVARFIEGSGSKFWEP